MSKKPSKKRSPPPKNLLPRFAFLNPLGGFVAEEESDLNEYFVGRAEYVTPLRSLKSLVIHIGPKGHGKSAIQQVILAEKTTFDARILELRPKDIALWTVARTNDLTTIEGIDPRWLNRTLWEYLFCIEVFRAEYPRGFDTLWSKVAATFSGDKNTIKKLLEKGFSSKSESRSAAESFAELVKEIRFAGSIGKVSAEVEVGTRDPSEKRRQSQKRETILACLSEVMRKTDRLLSHDYLILLDDLDLHWTNTATHRDLLEGLVAALQTLSSLPRFHFVVSLRSDIFEKLHCEHADKIDNGLVSVSWTKARLKKLLLGRIAWALEMHEEQALFGKVFETDCWSMMHGVAFDNPRRLIGVAEAAIVIAKNRELGRVSKECVAEAIRNKSASFLSFFETLHHDDYPGIGKAAGVFRKLSREFSFSDFEGKHPDVIARVPEDSRHWIEMLSPEDTLRLFCECGLLLYKRSRDEPCRPFASARDDIDGECWFATHPAFRSALGVQ